MIRRALLSVYDKRGIVELGRRLADRGTELVSTGGTSRHLSDAGLPVRSVSSLSGFPEILDGRVKTLVPQIHAGILGKRDEAGHEQQLRELGIGWIDLVVVNLYPFGDVCRRPGVGYEECVENIDVGGPTMIRAAAKNHRDVVVVVSPDRYDQVLDAIESGQVSPELRRELAAEAFSHLSGYDALIAAWLGTMTGRGPRQLPDKLCLCWERQELLRYGENPHQPAAIYRNVLAGGPSLVGARQLAGKPLSYNNINDADAALGLARLFPRPTAVAVKHATPCGVGTADRLLDAYARAHAADPVSIFGGVIAANRLVDEETAVLMTETFLEVVIAPGFTSEAVTVFSRKPGVRLLEMDGWPVGERWCPDEEIDLKSVAGGLLIQGQDSGPDDPSLWRLVAGPAVSQEVMADLELAWTVARFVKSNGIVIAAGGRTVGICGGQTNRIDAARMALERAKDSAVGAVLASDGFFPFPDVVSAAREAGIAAIVQPGGSLRDEESVAAADAAGIAMLFTGVRHFRH